MKQKRLLTFYLYAKNPIRNSFIYFLLKNRRSYFFFSSFTTLMTRNKNSEEYRRNKKKMYARGDGIGWYLKIEEFSYPNYVLTSGFKLKNHRFLIQIIFVVVMLWSPPSRVVLNVIHFNFII